MVPSTKIDFSDPAIIVSALARTDLTNVELTASAPPGVTAVAYSPSLNIWVATGFGNFGIFIPDIPPGFWYSKDGGDSWTQADAPWAADIIFKAVVWTGARFIAIGGTQSMVPIPPNLVATSEDGINWETRPTPLDGVTAYFPSSSTPEPVSAFLTNISGSGDLWFASGPTLSSVFPGDTLPGEIFLVAIYSHDGGLTWANATMPTFFDPISGLTLSGSVGQSLWDGSKFIGLEAQPGSYSNQSIYSSSDGSSWDLVTAGPDYPGDALFAIANTIAKVGSHLLVFGQYVNLDSTNRPVYYDSGDDGATWSGPFDDAVPNDGDSLYNMTVHGVLFRSGLNELTAIIDGNDWSTLIYFTHGDPSPWDSVDTGFNTYWGGIQGTSTPYMDYGKFGGAIPLRRYPRDDGLGASTQRRLPLPTSTQVGLRRGPTAIT